MPDLPEFAMPAFRVVVFLLGVALIAATLLSAIRTFVLPRSARDRITFYIFRISRQVFNFLNHWSTTYEQRDERMALYAPVTLLIMPMVWLMLVLIGYMGMFWAIGAQSLKAAFTVSGSSLLTLGLQTQDGVYATMISFSEATIGLILIALLIAYLPTMYSAFSRRELAVTLLEVRAGSPPSAIELFTRYNRLKRLDKLTELWVQWENVFVDLEESHTSLAALAFFRSPQPHRSWITASGAVLDAAALAASTVDIPRDAQAELTLRAGYIALRRIADFFQIQYIENPEPTDPISISRLEFDIACNTLAEQNVPLKADRDLAWKNFAGWRVNYDTVLLRLCAITMAPYAPWSSDRSLIHWKKYQAQRRAQIWWKRLLRRKARPKMTTADS